VIRCKMTMGLILRTVCKTGREILLTNREDEGDGDERKERRTQAFDTLCLVLGLLTNLVQVVEHAKDVLRRTRMFFFSFQIKLFELITKKKKIRIERCMRTE